MRPVSTNSDKYKGIKLSFSFNGIAYRGLSNSAFREIVCRAGVSTCTLPSRQQIGETALYRLKVIIVILSIAWAAADCASHRMLN